MDETDAAATSPGNLSQLILEGKLLEHLGVERDTLGLGLVIARNQLAKGDTAGALRTYSTLVILDARNPDFQLGLANCAWSAGEWELSLQAASASVALSPRNPRGYFFSGRACLALGHIAEAKQDLHDAIEFGRQARESAVVQEAQALLRTIEDR